MSVAVKLLQVNQVKQDIKVAIETKGIPMTNVAFTEYANKILDISGGGGVVDEYFYYSKAYYTITNNSTLFSNAWQDMKDSETVLFDIPLALAAPNQEMGGMTIDLYVGTNGQLQALYDACVNEVIPLPSSGNLGDIYLINNVAVKYYGEISGDIGFPIPLFEFGSMEDASGFIIGDLTPLSMGLGLVLAKIVGVSIPNNNIVIQQGFEFESESGIIIPNSVTSIGEYAFLRWTSNNQPLVIPNSVTSIGGNAFRNWEANNQPLVIPNSVTSIGEYAFLGWTSNNQPLVIPNSVIEVGDYAFENWKSNNQQLTIPNSVTTIGYSAFSNWTSNNHPLTIPNSVTSISQGAFNTWSANTHSLTIPNSVTSIGNSAFSNWSSAKEFIMESETPPTITSNSFFNTTAPIYVPNGSVEAYKTATNWAALANRIFPMSDR